MKENEEIKEYFAMMQDIIDSVESIPDNELSWFINKYNKYIKSSIVYLAQNLGLGTEEQIEFAAILISAFFFSEGKQTK